MQAGSLPKPAVTLGTPHKTDTSQVKSRSYKDAYRFVLSNFHKRFVNYLFFFSLIFAILFQTGFTFNYRTVLSVISYKTFFFSLLLFIVGICIYTLRNVTYTVWEPTYPSYIAELLSWTSLDNLVLLGFYTSSSLVIIRTYFSWIMGEKYTSGFLLQPPGHYLGARQLNQENIFICVYAVILSINYTFHYLKNRNYVVKINNVQQPFHYEIKTSFATIACNSAMRALYSFRNTYIVFILCNGSIYYYVARFFGFYNKVLDSPIVGFRWIDLHLFLRLIVSGMLTTCIYNVTNRLFEATYSYTLPLTDPYQNQFECLVEGLSEQKRDYLKVAAFSELALLANKRPDKRVQLFNTVGRELQDSAWYKVMTECFKMINEFRGKIDVEYNGTQKAAAPVPVSQPVEQKIRDRLEFSTGNVYASAKKNQIYYDDRTSTIFGESAELAEHELNATVPTVVENLKTKAITNFTQNDMVKMLKGIELKFGYSGTFESIYGETLTRRVQTVFNKYQLLIWAVQSLGSLTANSLKEDPFGYVQNDIHAVLNTLLGCLTDVEKYIQSPPVQYKSLLDENQICGEPEAVKMALREAIYQITTAFSEYTSVFQIDGKYSKKWERFLTFQE